MSHRPIGYWLKEVDRLLEESFERLLSEERLTRRHWQVLNTLADGPATQSDVDDALAPFRSGSEPTTAPVVAELSGRGWMRDTDGLVTLTAEGTAAHAALSRRVAADRRRVMSGVTAEEYGTVVAVLERMAANLAGSGPRT
ncbi:MAG TPA: MarR family transcriptional regulator [Actinophytocola sp.]|uniref:MarR family winged helix-turn-helix transcriptional regulator n=1 Tax=Actinophytocola sp. TaxID=1872138 RepID=UPI002DDD51DF|nr:MarR family transcriptional regulator [Actinophytocola sp.]HEV2780318.1 MarR family transcriptional regulator [Actinophytocola sp.]